MMLSPTLKNWIQRWLRDHDQLQRIAIILIYIQIGCGFVGSLGALYNGVLLVNLGISLFALVAIESSSQRLVRTYAVLLFCAILLDITWFILFSYEIWNFSFENGGKYFVFSVRVAFAMQIVGFSLRLLSSFFWIQMYRLGVSYLDISAPRETDNDSRYSFPNPGNSTVNRQTSDSDGIVGGSSLYDPAYYSPLFEDAQESEFSLGGRNNGIKDHRHTFVADASRSKPSRSRSFQAGDVDITVNKARSHT